MQRHKQVRGVANKVLVMSVISLTAVCLAPPALAQQGYQPPTKKNMNRTWGAPTQQIRKEQPVEFRATNLDRDVALPNLPGYTGKQVFVSGLLYPNAKDGPGYYVVYNTEHTQAQVKEWWANALKMDPWKISYTDFQTIKAHGKDGSKCTITAGPIVSTTAAKNKGMNGSYSIYFHVAQKPQR
jgi:hypothetical protein